jgi:hypothetical protein
MAARKLSEPFEEIAHAGGAAAQRVEDVGDAASWVAPSAATTAHVHAGDRWAESGRESDDRAACVARAIGTAAGTVVKYVREHDRERFQGDLASLARRHPERALAACSVAGFVVGLLLWRPGRIG